MRINEKQLLMLIETLKDTLVFYERDNADPFTFNRSIRIELLQEILNQQSNDIMDIK